MSSIAVLGAIFGDEAKAKIVDVLSSDADVVVRFQGGSNAGHTIKHKTEKYVFHLVPSGILYPNVKCCIGSGVCLDLEALSKEIADLKKQGIKFTNRFFIDTRANIVLPYHKEKDGSNEKAFGQTKIGTTKRGIGPCYSDAAARIGIKFSDLNYPDYLHERVLNFFRYHQLDLTKAKETANKLLSYYNDLMEYQTDLPYLLQKFHNEGKKIIFEGAQGSLLDINFGTYPFVTSSSTISGGISSQLGFPPNKIDKILGIYKSYFTRVGEGPFPTELKDSTGDYIRTAGNEFGSTTGRPRRVGWFDAVAAKYTAILNGFDEIALTLLDVLSGLPEIKICTSYSLRGYETDIFPASVYQLQMITPNYIELPGWNEDISKIRKYADLPDNAKKYVETIENLLEKKVSIISVGAKREETIIR